MRSVAGRRVCMDYQKLNAWTEKNHIPMPFMDKMLDRLVGNGWYCFLDGYSGYNQISIAPEDQEKTTFTCPYGTFTFKRLLFGLCNAAATFRRCMMSIFFDMVVAIELLILEYKDTWIFGSSIRIRTTVQVFGKVLSFLLFIDRTSDWCSGSVRVWKFVSLPLVPVLVRCSKKVLVPPREGSPLLLYLSLLILEYKDTWIFGSSVRIRTTVQVFGKVLSFLLFIDGTSDWCSGSVRGSRVEVRFAPARSRPVSLWIQAVVCCCFKWRVVAPDVIVVWNRNVSRIYSVV
uniref:Reverse transcriptase domain-containing protein n=1 Tax=Solanum lycopersicum TaxID=4081 RepID=A0A3Q7GF33_SOLLC